jgi:hypothetical protein
MDQFYLGFVEFIHEELWGRIRPLALVKKRSADDAWVVDRACKPDEMGNTGRVFWPKIPRDQEHLVRHYVRFRVELNQRARDPERDDEYVVAEEWRNGVVRRVATLGQTIIPDDRLFGPERLLDSDAGLRPEEVVYRWRLKGTIIDGPWRVAEVSGSTRLCLQPKADGHVVEYALPRLGSETFHVWDNGEGENQAVLLVEPAKAGGRVIDLLPASGLAEWLLRVLKRDKPLLTSFDRASPGWRSHISELLDTVTDPVQVGLDRSRFARLEAALGELAQNEARLTDLAELPRFKETLDAAIRGEVETARGRIEAQAQEETRGYVGRLKQERERERAQAERERLALQRELDKVRAEIAGAERIRAEARARVEQDESSLRTAADYLVESRDRIIRDFSVFHGLIENARASGNGSANGHSQGAAKLIEAAAPAATEAGTEGPVINDQGVFLRDRLVPAMAAWGAEATWLQAKRLHAALVSCRWVAVSCPSWGVAYAEALGADARHHVLAVEPTWLSFSDAWRDLETFWCEAVERSDALHLLTFADADRALVQCWARPLLDVVSGLRSALPSGLPWPVNLRVMACPAADEAALYVPEWVVSHWAGVKSAAGATSPDQPIVPGHVPFSVWREWAKAPAEAPRPAAGLGIAARSAARERSALVHALQRLDLGGDREEAQEVAREIRELDARAVFARGAR